MMKIRQKVTLEVGLQYARQTHKFVDIPIVDPDGGDLIGTRDEVLQYDYVVVPLKYNFMLLHRNRLNLQFSLGVMGQLFQSAHAKNFVENLDDTAYTVRQEFDTVEFGKLTFGLLAGVVVSYDLPENWTVQIAPIMRYSLGRLYESQIGQFNYSYGVEFGLVRRL